MPPTVPDTRALWITLLTRVVSPPLQAMAHGQLRATMPVGNPARAEFCHLEAIGRSLTGLAPWLELAGESSPSQDAFRDLARSALARAVDPHSPDRLNFTEGRQPLVDAAFLAHALLRAPRTLWEGSEPATRTRLADALRSTRAILPGPNNWLLFSALVEAALLRFTGEADAVRLAYAVRQFEQWYQGDGTYGDGAEFHWDYYNSFVIHPMLLDICETVQAHPEIDEIGRSLLPAIRNRALRYASVQERFVGPDGSFPPLGRSLAYRCGAFHHLAFMALRGDLPPELSPGQARCALTAVIRRTLEAPGTFDPDGWLQIGLAGHQPGLAEGYICTGSLYLCTAAFLPLGLPSTAPFWAEEDKPWTSLRLWGGQDADAPDHALA